MLKLYRTIPATDGEFARAGCVFGETGGSTLEDLHNGHRERLRLRLEKEGIDEFEPHEVLEFLLYYVDQRGDKNPVAHDLLDRFGSLEDVLAADEHILRGVRGVGSRGAVWLKHIWAMTQS